MSERMRNVLNFRMYCLDIDIENYNENYLKIFSRNVLNMIRKGESGWEKSLPPKVAQKIKKGRLFGFKPSK